MKPRIGPSDNSSPYLSNIGRDLAGLAIRHPVSPTIPDGISHAQLPPPQPGDESPNLHQHRGSFRFQPRWLAVPAIFLLGRMIRILFEEAAA